jgi:Transglutaminase-like superfamily
VKRIWTLLLAAPLLAAAADGETIWYSIAAADGAPFGYSAREVRTSGGGTEIVQTTEMRVQEGANPTTRIRERTIVRLDRAGRPVAMSDRVETGRSWVALEARIGAGEAEITRQTPLDRRTITVSLPQDVRFDDGQELLRDWNPAAAPRLEYRSFNLSAMAVERVVVEAAPGSAPDAEGRIALLRMRYDGANLRAVQRLQLGRDRRLAAITQPMFGAGITTSVTDRATALASHPPYRALRASMVRSPYRISDAAMQGHIRYRFSFADGLGFALPETGEQRAAAGAGGVALDICRDCGPGLAHDPASLADALRPTMWMQSDDRRILAIARPIARLHVSDARKMDLLVRAAQPYLTRIDFAGHFSALETLQRRAGDCTEASVLLAALGRAAGIPTRVVNGLAYSRPLYHGVSNVFMPHSWTLAYVDGAWRSFDLALGNFDATHIALTVGDGDARSVQAALQLAALLRWDGMTEIRPRRAAN